VNVDKKRPEKSRQKQEESSRWETPYSSLSIVTDLQEKSGEGVTLTNHLHLVDSCFRYRVCVVVLSTVVLMALESPAVDLRQARVWLEKWVLLARV
jgi:hypothetical protein